MHIFQRDLKQAIVLGVFQKTALDVRDRALRNILNIALAVEKQGKLEMVNRPITVANEVRVDRLLYVVTELTRALILLSQHPKTPILFLVFNKLLNKLHHDFLMILLQENITDYILRSGIWFF